MAGFRQLAAVAGLAAGLAVAAEYRTYKPPFCPSSEASYPKPSHSFTVQVTVVACAPVQFALIRVGLAVESLAGGTLDVSCATGRCEAGSVGLARVNHIDDSEMGRKDWGPRLVAALVVIRTIYLNACQPPSRVVF